MFAISIDGILRGPDKQSIPAGIALYRALNQFSSVALVGSDNSEFDEYWVRTNFLETPSVIVSRNSSRTSTLAQVVYLRNSGYRIDAVIDSDPTVVAELHLNGFTTLHFLSPSFSSPSIRPDQGPISSWSTLVSTVEAEKQLKAGVKFHFETDDDE